MGIPHGDCLCGIPMGIPHGNLPLLKPRWRYFIGDAGHGTREPLVALGIHWLPLGSLGCTWDPLVALAKIAPNWAILSLK